MSDLESRGCPNLADQGPDQPVATFSELISDGNDRFRIADISPTVLPPKVDFPQIVLSARLLEKQRNSWGSYDVRVKARKTHPEQSFPN